MTVALGLYFGLQPLIFPVLIVLGFPPVVMHCVVCSRVMDRTRVEHPKRWRDVGRASQIRACLFDGQDFGDRVIAHDKRELRWWLRAGLVSIMLFLPSLFVIEHFGPKEGRTSRRSEPLITGHFEFDLLRSRFGGLVTFADENAGYKIQNPTKLDHALS